MDDPWLCLSDWRISGFFFLGIITLLPHKHWHLNSYVCLLIKSRSDLMISPLYYVWVHICMFIVIASNSYAMEEDLVEIGHLAIKKKQSRLLAVLDQIYNFGPFDCCGYFIWLPLNPMLVGIDQIYYVQEIYWASLQDQIILRRMLLWIIEFENLLLLVFRLFIRTGNFSLCVNCYKLEDRTYL